MSRYKANKQDAITYNDEPTMTDQSQAESTDINIIVTQFLRTGHTPGQQPPIFADFASLPEDLRGFIDMGRSIEEHRGDLPEALRRIPLNDLVNMSDEQITAILTPPEPKKGEQNT